MSPHAIPAEANPFIDLNKFSVTRNAFLPAHSPCEVLSDNCYQPWEIIAQHLPQHIERGSIRRAVQDLPVLPTDRLRSLSEWRRAYVILAFMTHAYVWGGDQPEQILPPQITIPFLQVSEHLELPPVLSYSAANLWNFASTSDDFTDLTSLRTLCSFTGTESESWFLLISVAMEARGAEIINTMTEAIGAIRTRDYETITTALEQLRDCIRGVGILLDRMYERCDPMTFYHKIRPFLAGSKNMAAAGLPKGVFYDEGNGEGEWRQLRGGSNGQSSMIQFFDVVLGVDHKGNGDSSTAPVEKSFHAEVREYMPGPHARFLVHVSRMGSIRELALLPPSTPGQHRLRAAYTAATEALAEFRNKHIQIVTRYIVLPSRQSTSNGARRNLASSSSTQKTTQELTGTGGTALIPFLKQSRDETAFAGQLDQ
ncbi:Indoleamine 2,3-dioxygenase [Emericellopsis atlantica]|uniref:Indoleamine 2,3-dioxygenase n=1 Tax=Emericellopsis atlantica TaxID=2614577 RepID=A0A9P8CRJ7_9HYPO|nr:Indoleamine 2,3-dioxygenase [Emericellopsis atlantica]KAG9254791.1 Indoleamine 2,3-dioxygenase [Emericellopsis atlantica]